MKQAQTRQFQKVFGLTGQVLVYVALSLVATVLTLVANVAMSRVFDQVLAASFFDSALVRSFVMLVFLFVVAQVASIFFANYFPNRFSVIRGRRTTIAMMRDLLAMPLQTYGQREQGFFYNVMTSTSGAIAGLYTRMSVRLVSACVSFACLLAFLFWVQPLFGLMTLFYVPLLLALMVLPTRLLASANEKSFHSQDKALGQMKRLLETKRVISIARAESTFQGRLKVLIGDWISWVLKLRWMEQVIELLPSGLSTVFQISLLGVGAWFYAKGAMTLGTLVLVYQVAKLVQGPLSQIVSILSRYKGTAPQRERLEEFCALVEGPSGFEGKFTPSSYLASFEDAKLYANGEKERLLFDAPAMTLPQKGLVVIKGANGSGKSMLVNYLTGFGDASAFEGKSELNENLQKASYLTYPLLLTKGSFTDNLFGKGYDQEVATMLGIDFFEKEIDDEKVNLSFGEGQKLNLLRVLSSPSPVLVLDEPFTNLDKETIARLTDYLLKQKQNKAIIAITHSPELDAGADAIYAIRDGQLVGEKEVSA